MLRQSRQVLPVISASVVRPRLATFGRDNSGVGRLSSRCFVPGCLELHSAISFWCLHPACSRGGSFDKVTERLLRGMGLERVVERYCFPDDDACRVASGSEEELNRLATCRVYRNLQARVVRIFKR